MGVLDIILVALGLSMDAFAVAICKGLCMKQLNIKQALIIALSFGVFQAGMPLIGWTLGRQFAPIITSVDHWIAFGLLFIIGLKMLWEARQDEESECPAEGLSLKVKELLMLSLATSIDALAVGITFAFLNVNIGGASVGIGLITFAFAFFGVWVGYRFGARLEKTASIVGGVVLIGIGTKILLEHLGIVNF